jgi:hypothetical protein
MLERQRKDVRLSNVEIKCVDGQTVQQSREKDIDGNQPDI